MFQDPYVRWLVSYQQTNGHGQVATIFRIYRELSPHGFSAAAKIDGSGKTTIYTSANTRALLLSRDVHHLIGCNMEKSFSSRPGDIIILATPNSITFRSHCFEALRKAHNRYGASSKNPDGFMSADSLMTLVQSMPSKPCANVSLLTTTIIADNTVRSQSIKPIQFTDVIGRGMIMRLEEDLGNKLPETTDDF
jgi:hypothetical protein